MSSDERLDELERLAIIGSELREEVRALRTEAIPQVRSQLEDRFRRLVGRGLVVLGVATAVVLTVVLAVFLSIRSTQGLLIECSTPPAKPPPPAGVIDTREADERHPCAEDAQASRGAAIRAIVDSDQDGTVDYDAVKAALIRIEAALMRLELNAQGAS